MRWGVIEALLAAGAAVDARDEDGNTALHEASRYGHLACVDALVLRRLLTDAAAT